MPKLARVIEDLNMIMSSLRKPDSFQQRGVDKIQRKSLLRRNNSVHQGFSITGWLLFSLLNCISTNSKNIYFGRDKCVWPSTTPSHLESWRKLRDLSVYHGEEEVHFRSGTVTETRINSARPCDAYIFASNMMTSSNGDAIALILHYDAAAMKQDHHQSGVKTIFECMSYWHMNPSE